MQNQVSKIWIR